MRHTDKGAVEVIGSLRTSKKRVQNKEVYDFTSGTETFSGPVEDDYSKEGEASEEKI